MWHLRPTAWSSDLGVQIASSPALKRCLITDTPWQPRPTETTKRTSGHPLHDQEKDISFYAKIWKELHLDRAPCSVVQLDAETGVLLKYLAKQHEQCTWMGLIPNGNAARKEHVDKLVSGVLSGMKTYAEAWFGLVSNSHVYV
jgi:hypothetical protein